jgi:hypothetical protein
MTNAFSRPIISSVLNINADEVKDWIFNTDEGKKCVLIQFKKILKHEKKREERFLIPLMKKLKGKYENIIIRMFRIHTLLCSIYKFVIEKKKRLYIIATNCILDALKELTNQIQLANNGRHKKIFVLFIKYANKYVRRVNKIDFFENSGYFVDL